MTTTFDADTATPADLKRPAIPGIVLASATQPPAVREPGGYGVGWLLRAPLRSGGWLAVAALLTVPVGLALAFWLACSPRRAALTTAAGLLIAGLHR
jgi:hypothetical protein